MLQFARLTLLRMRNLNITKSCRFLSSKTDDKGQGKGEEKKAKCGRKEEYSTKPNCKKAEDKKSKQEKKDPCQDLKDRFGPKKKNPKGCDNESGKKA